MFSGLLSGAKEKAVWLNRSGVHKGDNKVKLHPFVRSWGLIFDSIYQVLPPSTVYNGENEEVTSFNGPMSILQGLI